jgi:hypothetical protein
MRKSTERQDNMIKIAFIRKVKGKGWCVFGHRKTKGGKRRNFGCYKTKEAAKKRLGQIYFFKGRGALDGIVEAADLLDRKGMMHLADALMESLEMIVAASLGDAAQGFSASVKLGKVASLLESKGEHVLSDRIDGVIPDVLDLESGALAECDSCPDMSVSIRSARAGSCRSGMSADKVYAMAVKLRDLWRQGLADEHGFEHKKLREFRCMLKAGYLLPPPPGQEVPDDGGNWWDYFESKGGKVR